MSCRAGFVWESKQPFCRYIEDCGIPCEVVTPQILAAPFFRGMFSCFIIPTGFANPQYSKLLPALRASSGRIKTYLENGGNLLVFGAAIDKPDVYDWLPFSLTYRHDYQKRSVTCSSSCMAATLLEDFDNGCIECDGSFHGYAGTAAGSAEGTPLILEEKVGKGCVIVTSVHEYPSRSFLRHFCGSGTQTLF